VDPCLDGAAGCLWISSRKLHDRELVENSHGSVATLHSHCQQTRRVVPATEVLRAALDLARTLATKAPVALRYAKEAVVKGLELPLADGLRLEGDLSTLLRTTEDRVEGARAFLEKRSPRWTGR
jgi:1,4-dihydroxy-2-naphthoyl-CoA synthase